MALVAGSLHEWLTNSSYGKRNLHSRELSRNLSRVWLNWVEFGGGRVGLGGAGLGWVLVVEVSCWLVHTVNFADCENLQNVLSSPHHAGCILLGYT